MSGHHFAAVTLCCYIRTMYLRTATLLGVLREINPTNPINFHALPGDASRAGDIVSPALIALRECADYRIAALNVRHAIAADFVVWVSLWTDKEFTLDHGPTRGVAKLQPAYCF